MRNAEGVVPDSCKSDSGGPLLVYEDRNDGFTHWTQAGKDHTGAETGSPINTIGQHVEMKSQGQGDLAAKIYMHV